jgi:hypothetical protein
LPSGKGRGRAWRRESDGDGRAVHEARGDRGFAIYDVPSLAEAKEWTRRFLDVHVEHFAGWDCEVEIRQMMDDPPATTVDAGGGLSR